MTEYQQLLLTTFKAFDKFCVENGITYYGAFGTALGAVRHKGFIPWDDDLDVLMARKDYERLIALKGKLLDTPYRFTHIEDGENFYLFGKFYSTEQSIWEFKQWPQVIGPWVDVFVMDEDCSASPNTGLSDRLATARWKYMKTIQRQTWKQIARDLSQGRVLMASVRSAKKCIFPLLKRFYLSQITRLNRKISAIKGDSYYRYGIGFPLMPKSHFGEPIRIPFEDTTILVPSKVEEHLVQCFGDWRQLPPESERVSHHKMYYVDLHHSKTIEQIVEEIGDETEDATITLRGLIEGFRNRKKF